MKEDIALYEKVKADAKERYMYMPLKDYLEKQKKKLWLFTNSSTHF